MVQEPLKDFFISYTSTDRTWAEWIAWQLEAEGYSTVIQAWDFRPGSSFVLEMDRAAKEAARTIAVLSPDYLNAEYPQSEWAAAFRRDPTGSRGVLLPVRVQKCEVKGLLGPIVYIDLVDLDDLAASEMLLAGVRRLRAKPSTPPPFPGARQRSQLQQSRFPGAFPSIWTVPYRRNPFFTGRDELLRQLHGKLTTTKVAALTQPQAINGLGGIGKTQIAVEYAYRYREDYQAILWIRTSSRDTVISDFVVLAALLHLPEKNEQDQNVAVGSVKRWLTNHAGWLLIMDNADDLDLAFHFLPTGGSGHILLTTRAQAVGSIANNIEVEKMSREEGVLLLLRRAKVIATDASLDMSSEIDRTKAEAIVLAVDGLPLALDQAGAYIEETGCSVSAYLDRYQHRQITLLKRRGWSSLDHPEPVDTTWSLSFEQIEKANPVAADLLRLCAFLSPDAIPEEVILEGATDLGPLLRPVANDPSLLDEAIGDLRRFSLVRRNSDINMLTIHRLVQAVLKESMSDETRRQWAERTVRAINRAFPAVEVATWPRCQRCIPQAQACAELIKQSGLAFPEAAELLNKAAYYVHDHALYTEAEPLYQLSLAIREEILGPEHSDTAISLHNLAMLYHDQGRYEKAEPLYQRALAIGEKVLGTEHPDTAATLNNLAVLYRDQGQYEKAEVLLKRALEINEQVLGPKHLHTAASLYNLAAFYQDQRQYEKAEPLLKRAMTIREQVLGPEHPDFAKTLNNLGMFYHVQGQYEKAEPLLKPALAILERVLGPEHPYTVTVLKNYADLLRKMKREGEAASLEARAKTVRAKLLP